MRRKPLVFCIVGLACAVAVSGIVGDQTEILRADDPRVKGPEKVTHVAPVYPEEAREARIQGTVEVELIVGVSGTVDSAKVTKSDPHFDAATIEAVRQWKYRPATLEGKPVSVILTVTVNFRLE